MKKHQAERIKPSITEYRKKTFEQKIAEGNGILQSLQNCLKANDFSDIFHIIETTLKPAFDWMPFVAITYRQFKGADKIHLRRLESLRNNPAQLQQAQKLKNQMADLVHQILSAAYNQQGKYILPTKEATGNMDINSDYWNEVANKMRSQFTQENIGSVALSLMYGNLISVYAKKSKSSK